MKHNIILIFFLLMASTGKGQRIYISSNGDIWKLNLADCKVNFVIHANTGFLDISFDSKGNLYGVTGKLFKINTVNGALTKLIEFESSALNAMTISAEDIVYLAGSGGELFTYNLITGDSLYLGNMGIGAAGDLTFYKGELYMAAHGNKIVKVNIENPPASEILFDFNHPSEVFGIVSDFTDCDSTTCYAIAGGDPSDLFRIDFVNQKLEFVCQLNKSISGGASTTEFIASIAASVGNAITTNADCHNQNGKLELVNATGHGEVMFSLNNGAFQSTPLFTGLAAGQYLIRLQDQLGCTDSLTVTIHQTPPPEAQIVNILQATCNQSNGALSVSASGGIAPLAYSLDNVSFQTTTQFQNLHAGPYTIWVKDLNGCLDSVSTILESTSSINIISLQVVPTSCGEENGSIEVHVDQSNGATYSLDQQPYQSVPVFEHLKGDTYLISVRDLDGCMDTMSAFVDSSHNPEIVIQDLKPESCEQGNGEILVVGTDGAFPYTFSLDNNHFQSSGSFSGLTAGSYTIYIRDIHDCRNSTTVALTSVPGPQIKSLSIQPANCAQENGILLVELLNHENPITITLLDELNDEVDDFNQLRAGRYVLRLEDNTGCSFDSSFSVPALDCPFFIPNIFSPDQDGINDHFGIQVIANTELSVLSFSIFDRWGNLVYNREGNSFTVDEISWDGTFHNHPMPSGVYTYKLELINGVKETIFYMGDITLLR